MIVIAFILILLRFYYSFTIILITFYYDFKNKLIIFRHSAISGFKILVFDISNKELFSNEKTGCSVNKIKQTQIGPNSDLIRSFKTTSQLATGLTKERTLI